jgi:hypothetical protein
MLSSIYLRKVGCVLCLSHWDLPNHDTLPHYTIGTIRKPSMSKVHQGGSIMLRLIMQEFLNIEQYARVFKFLSKKIQKNQN